MSGSWIFWDFDGTLAHRPEGWTACLAGLVDEADPHLGITAERVRPHLATGFPWHEPDAPHTDLDHADAWWAARDRHFDAVLRSLDCPDHTVEDVLGRFRARYVDPAAFELLPDAALVLATLAQRGWRQLILSNHVPELATIVDALGIGGYLDAVISSGVIGYEKPHPSAYAAAIEVAGSPSRAWMIGDSLEADARGAERVGLASILVGGEPGLWTVAAGSLRDLLDLVGDP